MDPVTLSLLLGGMGMNFMGGLFGGGGGQERQTFEGERRGNLGLAPSDVLGGALTAMGRHGDTLNERLGRGVNLPGAYAQSLPSFSGGGLPFPIGVTGTDPALADPSMLSLPGLTNRDPFQGIGSMMSGDPLNPRQQPAVQQPGMIPDYKFPQDGVRLRRPGQDLMAGQADDTDEALQAFKLLGI